ncbi:MAG: hypothetical protein ACOCXQ_00850 [Patescibacteria group bacterium]
MLNQLTTKITNEWFYDKPNTIWRYLLVFVKGDALVIVPFFLIVLIFGFLSLEFMMVMIGLYIAVRSLGEMVFWMFQQFGPRSYRPYDFGLTKLDNNAIYIIYQLIGLIGAVLGASLVLMMIYF